MYDFEKHTGMVALPGKPQLVPRKFVYLLREKDETFKKKKHVKINILISNMVLEMSKKQARARFYFSFDYFCILYFLMKILFVKLKNLHTLE